MNNDPAKQSISKSLYLKRARTLNNFSLSQLYERLRMFKWIILHEWYVRSVMCVAKMIRYRHIIVARQSHDVFSFVYSWG